jgi:hypothetical protein
MVEMRCSAAANKKRNKPQDSSWPKELRENLLQAEGYQHK